jgi:hypothetical protein
MRAMGWDGVYFDGGPRDVEFVLMAPVTTTRAHADRGNHTSTAVGMRAFQKGVIGWLGAWQGDKPVTLPVHLLCPSQAGRASLAVMCPSAGTYYIQTRSEMRAADAEASFIQNLLTLKVTGTVVNAHKHTRIHTHTNAYKLSFFLRHSQRDALMNIRKLPFIIML